MTKLVFTLEGDHSDLDWVRSRIDGMIQDELAEAEEDKRFDSPVEYGWEFDD